MEQDEYLRLVEESKKQELLEAKEKEKALKLAEETDETTIPVTNIPMNQILGVTIQPWNRFWEHSAIDLQTPIILERSQNVIGGPKQYFDAEEAGQKEIKGVYIDSLFNKKISAKNLEHQFNDKNVAMSFAYSLYACVFDLCDIVSYSDFCTYVYNNLENSDIEARIKQLISYLDGEMEM